MVPYLLSDEHGVAIFTKYIGQRAGLVMKLSYQREKERKGTVNKGL